MAQMIRLGKRNVTLYHFTGKVVEAAKNLETRVSGGGGGGYSYQGTGSSAPVVIDTTTTIHDQLFLVNKEGKEYGFQLRDFDIACRDTNIVTVMWATIEGQDRGRYFAVINHTTGSRFSNKGAVRRLATECTPSYLWVSLAMVVLLWIWIGGGIGNGIGIALLTLPFTAIPYLLYYNLIAIPKNVNLFYSQLQYPTAELW